MEDTCYKKTQSWGSSFAELEEFEDKCLKCKNGDYRHGTIMFNSFIWCQFFNEYTSRNLFNEVNPFRGIFTIKNGLPHVTNFAFVLVSIFMAGIQIIFVELFGKFSSTSPVPWDHWLVCVALGFIGVPIGMAYRFIPIEEDPNTFFDAFHGHKKDEKVEGQLIMK
jgi:hypothetical protein